MNAHKSVEQRAAKMAQKQLGCSYNAALMVARSARAKEMAAADNSSPQFRVKLAAAVVKIMGGQSKPKGEFDAVWDDVRRR